MSSTLKLDFEFSNAFAEKQNEIPLFFRQGGVQGSLKLGNPAGDSVDKVKLILRGMKE
jgi:sulfur relay (sulfurtransferase) complex TusBCD TusD component (DsrE family)